MYRTSFHARRERERVTSTRRLLLLIGRIGGLSLGFAQLGRVCLPGPAWRRNSVLLTGLLGLYVRSGTLGICSVCRGIYGPWNATLEFPDGNSDLI
ncbi:hypothetical protein F5X96DRAFT_180981 [Biscogniauxia mediterranea]|nr:hypothetical protein F5X96DRAFT_180981 [Biscogniauxia mediterranea]